jgi:predicted metalloprotease with PDZ domain
MPEPLLALDLREPQQHLVRASLRFTPSRRQLQLQLPGWTPGSYLIRDYVRHLEGLELLAAGRPIPLERTGVAHWSALLPDLQPLELRWRLLATELTVRTCHLNGDHGFLALAAVVPQLDGLRWQAHRLTLQLPADWQAWVPLPRQPDGHWLAADYDALIDAPIEAGPLQEHAFEVAGVPHRWVSWGGDPVAGDPAWLADVERICLTCCRLMGEPAPAAADYLFVLHLLEQGYGGLEHDNSCVLQFGRRALARPEGRRKLLQLVAHEYLHQWNVRRLRPAELAPIDYSRPTIIPTLWFAEGVTSYYDQLIPLAAGISGESELLEDLGSDLSRYRLTPGRGVQSLRESSQEAWVKLYRQDAYSGDAQISYYLKGAVLALILDLHLRRHGSALCVVLQQLWHSHGRHRRGYREVDLFAAFSSQAADLSTLLPQWLDQHDDPPVDDYLADVGLQLLAETSGHANAGWDLESSQGSVRLRRVSRQGAAERAGLEVGDELLAINSERLVSPELAAGLIGPAAEVELLFCRDGRVRTTMLDPGEPALERWQLRSDPGADPTRIAARQRWLSLLP